MRTIKIAITAIIYCSLVSFIAADRHTDDVAAPSRIRKLKGGYAENNNAVSIIPEDSQDENVADSGTRVLKGKNPPPPQGCRCNGFEYYQVVTFPEPSNWNVAYSSTPDGCVLAPVSDVDELEEVKAVVDRKTMSWVGIMKSAGQAKRDNANDAPEDAPLTGWYNLDGSRVDVDASLWAPNEPGNCKLGENRAYLNAWEDEPALVDVYSKQRAHSAVYKCCAENTDMCKVDNNAF